MPSPDWYPSVDDVAALVRARTKTAFGGEEGTFTRDTRPTADNVEGLIAQAAGDIISELSSYGLEVCEAIEVDAAGTCCLKAAMLVELSYFPEQSADNEKSPYLAYEKMYNRRIDSLLRRAKDQCGGAGIEAGLAQYAFPERVEGVEGALAGGTGWRGRSPERDE